MSYSHRLIILSSLMFSPNIYAAYDVFVDGLYWQASEQVEWVLNSTLNSAQNNVTYETITFSAGPGFRAGVGYQGDWDSSVYLTSFYTKSTATAIGNLTGAYFGAKLLAAANGNIFYRTGQVSFSIKYNIVDWDLSKSFNVTPNLIFRPIMGVRGGWIYQTINTNMQGAISLSENLTNDFKGIGPKAGMESLWLVYNRYCYKIGIFANFSTSYLWGTWNISDVTTDTANITLYTNVGGRNFGAFTLQGILGLGLDYKCLSVKLGYEISDWFNQFQVFDDATGAHNNDLILQGLTLKLAYKF